MRWSLLALGLVFGIPALAQEVADTRAAELAKLRREVETMSQELTLANEDLRSQLKAIEAQKVEIEVQIRREELRLAQIDGEAASRALTMSRHDRLEDAPERALRAEVDAWRGLPPAP